MKFIVKRSVDMLLRENIKSESKYLDDPNPNHAEQAKENIEEWKNCIESPEAARLISKWNDLVREAAKIQSEANQMNPVFGQYFKIY